MSLKGRRLHLANKTVAQKIKEMAGDGVNIRTIRDRRGGGLLGYEIQRSGKPSTYVVEQGSILTHTTEEDVIIKID